MHGLSGIELLRKITEHYKDTAVIVASGIDRTQRVMDAIRVGASDYLLKPCDLDVLANSVERALERRMLLRNARRYKQDLEHRNIELASQKTEMERLQVQVLRLFSRLDEAEVKRVDLNEGIQSTVRLLSTYYSSGRIALVSNYGEIPQVNCYAAQLNQVWMNLLVNAAQAIGTLAGEVRIT